MQSLHCLALPCLSLYQRLSPASQGVPRRLCVLARARVRLQLVPRSYRYTHNDYARKCPGHMFAWQAIVWSSADHNLCHEWLSWDRIWSDEICCTYSTESPPPFCGINNSLRAAAIRCSHMLIRLCPHWQPARMIKKGGKAWQADDAIFDFRMLRATCSCHILSVCAVSLACVSCISFCVFRSFAALFLCSFLTELRHFFDIFIFYASGSAYEGRARMCKAVGLSSGSRRPLPFSPSIRFCWGCMACVWVCVCGSLCACFLISRWLDWVIFGASKETEGVSAAVYTRIKIRSLFSGIPFLMNIQHIVKL